MLEFILRDLPSNIDDFIEELIIPCINTQDIFLNS